MKSFTHSKIKQESHKEFARLDSAGTKNVCREEIASFVGSNAELWAMLSVNLDMSEDHCREVATRVAMELATGLQGDEALASEIDKHQFHKFRKHYILDPKGSQEFFHRSVFAAFDEDMNHYLDDQELDVFLDTFYKSGSIFKGDVRLPAKAELKRVILEKHDKNNDRRLSFNSVRGIISGAALHDLVLESEKGKQKKKAMRASVRTSMKDASSSANNNTKGGGGTRSSASTKGGGGRSAAAKAKAKGGSTPLDGSSKSRKSSLDGSAKK